MRTSPRPAAPAAGTPGVEFVAGGFGEIEAVEAFDLIVAIGGSWWYLLTPVERADALARVARSLRLGGLVVLDGANLEWILDHYREQEPSEAEVNGIRVRRVPHLAIDRRRGIWTHTDTFTTPAGEALTMVHRLAIVPVDEIEPSLRSAGFDYVGCYRNWEATAPEPRSGSRIIAVGRRPKAATVHEPTQARPDRRRGASFGATAPAGEPQRGDCRQVSRAYVREGPRCALPRQVQNIRDVGPWCRP